MFGWLQGSCKLTGSPPLNKCELNVTDLLLYGLGMEETVAAVL